MKKTFLTFIFVGLIFQSLFAQPGHYFLSHYKPGNENISYRSFDIQQDKHGILYFANRSGVLQFDGRTWEMVPIKGAVYSLSVTEQGDVFAAGSSGFGKIGLNDKNQLSYLPLSDSLANSNNIIASYALDKAVFFLNEKYLIKLDSGTTKPRTLLSATSEQGLFTGLFQIGASLYVNTEKEGLKKIVGETLQPSDLPPVQMAQLVFSERSPNGKVDLIATQDNRFFIGKEGLSLIPFFPTDSLYLSANVVSQCAWVTDRMVAIGTLRGGIVFADIETGETLEISNYYAGLPDNQVYALLTDRHQGVWVAHDYGFTRVAPFLPFRTFNHYQGLDGNLLCVQSVINQVYVGTTLGLFLLERQEIFEDIDPPTPQKQLQPGNRKGFRQGPQKTVRILKEVEYVYKRVQGISGKVDQMAVVENRLLCGGVGGVFEVDGLVAQSVDREPVRNIFYSKNLQQLLLSTYDDKIKSFRPSNKGWVQTEFPDTLSMHADFMFEDNLQNLWICGRNRALKVGVDEGEILDAESIPLPHTSVDRTVGLAYGQEVYLTQNGEFFHYASFKNTFVKYDSLPDSKKYFASAGYFWFYDGNKWRTVDRKLQGSIKTEWLKLFPDIRFLAPAEWGKSLWVITGSNELYQFSSDDHNVSALSNPLFLKEVRGQQSKFAPGQKLKVEEGESALTFEFIQPEYVSLQSVEYRYWVKNLQREWTQWSTLNNVINFPFLPPGKYNVQVQSKDLFGKVTELESIDFNVFPPYWKRPWFYALEFFFFGSLVVLTLRMKGANTRYRYLSRFLSALTVIMLIQFIQTIAAANISLKSTPVADFFIQVLIALLVLPVEEFLRGRILKAASKS